MKMKFYDIRYILFSALLGCLMLPAFIGFFTDISFQPLKGAVIEPVKPEFNLRDWINGDFQMKAEKYLNDVFGLRSTFVRLNHQIEYSLFNKIHAAGVEVGKNNYLYEKNYIDAYFGNDFIGRDSIDQKIKKLKFLQDTLAKLNKDLILVFAAGKGSFYPEYFPEKYITKRKTTNYEVYSEAAKSYSLNFIDFNKYFLETKHSSKYSLYPQYGIHWSLYGGALAADSLIHYIEHKRKIDMQEIYWDTIVMDQPRDVDYDIGHAMNLLVKMKSFQMAYPEIKMKNDSTKTKPSVLVIADSFYWTMYNFGISNCFSKSDFWFYNKEVYSNTPNKPSDIDQLNLQKEIMDHDVIIVLASEMTLSRLGWGFIENSYNVFKHTSNIR